MSQMTLTTKTTMKLDTETRQHNNKTRQQMHRLMRNKLATKLKVTLI